MYEIIEELDKMRREYLEVLEKIEAVTALVPNEKLRVSVSNGTSTYYTRKKNENEKEKYLPKEKRHLAKELAQYEYAAKLKRELLKQIRVIEDAVRIIDYRKAADMYTRLPKGRRDIVEPYFVSDHEYIENWLSQDYEPKPFGESIIEIYTEKGERVRSKSEKIIADMLFNMGIPYKYESPLYLEGIGIVYPDFTILDIYERKTVYWEHLGMMDNNEYADKAVKKIAYYEKSEIFPGQNLILTFETRNCPISNKLVEGMIKKRFKL